MRNFLFYSTALLLLTFTTGVFAQTPMYHTNPTVTSGGNSIPFAYSSGCRGQQLYPVGVFGTPPSGQAITTLYFMPGTNYTGTQTYSNFHVSLKQANITSLSTTYETGMTQVFTSSSYSISYVGGNWFAIQLQTPFPYDPSLPLIWEINNAQSNSPSWFCRNKGSSVAGAYRNFSSSYNAASALGSGRYMLDMGFDLAPINTGYPNSATIGSICSPSSPTCTGIPTNLDVQIKNTGKLNLDSVLVGARIHYQLGAVRDTHFVAERMFYPNLPSNSTGPCESLFNWSNGFRTGDSVYVWTRSPNGVLDSAYADDTTLLVILPSMPGGTYTVSNDSMKTHDFNNIHEAISMLCDTFGGVCDTVIFQLDSLNGGSMTHFGQYTLCDVAGTSWQAPIIFRSNDSLGQPIELYYDSCDNQNNWIMNLAGSDHIIFENIKFRSEDAFGTGHSTNMSLDEAGDIRVLDCSFQSNVNNNGSANHALIATEGRPTGPIEIANSNFRNGSMALDISNGSGHHIHGNTIRDVYMKGISLSNSTNSTIEHNEIWSLSTLVASAADNEGDHSTGIYLANNKGAIEVNHNTIKASNSQWPVTGITVNGHNALGQSALLHNNVINIGQLWSSTQYHGIHVFEAVGVDFAFNSTAVNGNKLENSGFYANKSSGIELHNNIFASMLRGFAINLVTQGSVSRSNYNNYFSSTDLGNYGGTSQATLADWRSVTRQDSNSISTNPNYYNISRSDLHVCNPRLFEAGTPISGIMTDMDGDMRDPSKPCIGADEFAPVESFSLGDDYGLCPGDSTELVAGSGNFGEEAIWRDLGTGMPVDTNQKLVVNTPGSYEVTLINACGILVDSISIIQPDAVALPNDTNLCPDETVSVDASIVNGDTYSWSSGDTTAQVTITSAANYSIEVTDKWNCVTRDTMEVTYSERATLNVSDTVVCQGISITLFGHVSRGPNTTYQWDGFLGAPQITDDNVIIDYEQFDDQDTVVMTLTDDGCTTYDTATITRIARPTITYTSDSNGLAFIVKSNTSTGNMHWWDFGDGDTSNFPEPRHVYAAPGTYTVTYRNSNICGDVSDSREITLVLLSVDKLTGTKAGVLIYPNPSNGQFKIQFIGQHHERIKLQVRDLKGSVVLDQTINSVDPEVTEEVDLGEVSPGLYVVQLEVDGQIYKEKISIE